MIGQWERCSRWRQRFAPSPQLQTLQVFAPLHRLASRHMGFVFSHRGTIPCWYACCSGLKLMRKVSPGFFGLLIVTAAAMGCNANTSQSSVDSGSEAEASCTRDRNDKLVHPDVDFSCTTDDDCEIKDIRSGCGPYPRCINSEQTVPAFTCNETSGNCGYPEVRYCKCREQLCRSMQGDQKI